MLQYSLNLNVTYEIRLKKSQLMKTTISLIGSNI